MDAKLNERFKSTYNLRATAHAQTRCMPEPPSVPVSSTGSDRKHYDQLFLWLPRGHRIVNRTCQQNGKLFIKLFRFSFYRSANSQICTEFRFVLRAVGYSGTEMWRRHVSPWVCLSGDNFFTGKNILQITPVVSGNVNWLNQYCLCNNQIPLPSKMPTEKFWKFDKV